MNFRNVAFWEEVGYVLHEELALKNGSRERWI